MQGYLDMDDSPICYGNGPFAIMLRTDLDMGGAKSSRVKALAVGVATEGEARRLVDKYNDPKNVKVFREIMAKIDSLPNVKCRTELSIVKMTVVEGTRKLMHDTLSKEPGTDASK